jgi:hypothetical protein
LRDLPSRVLIYLLLAACLYPEVGYLEVWRKLTAELPESARWRRLVARWRRLATGLVRRRRGGCSTCCVAQQPRSGSMGRNGGACWSAQSTTPS